MDFIMNRKERLYRTLQGKNVDRPPFCFYEINGYDQNPDDPDPFNIYRDPSWYPLLELTREKTDRIIRRPMRFTETTPALPDDLTEVSVFMENGSRYTRETIRAGNRILSSRTRRDPDVNTVWTEEHLLKDADDLKAYLALSEQEFHLEPDISQIEKAEAELGDTGIVMVDIADPLCRAAELFDMAEFTIIAMTEPELFERFARIIHQQVEIFSRACPGRLWRIVGPEYASPPYLPPELFHRYVVPYDKPMVESIQKHGGFARIHSHGNLEKILDHIAEIGCVALDPIEPPPQGDVELAYVRKKYGNQMVLFGNLEATDIENLPTPKFEQKIITALKEGTSGSGRGFVLMPSACPYGLKLPPLAMANYEKMVELVEDF
jgi:uroporphyrinogen-III decarboxylase